MLGHIRFPMTSLAITVCLCTVPGTCLGAEGLLSVHARGDLHKAHALGEDRTVHYITDVTGKKVRIIGGRFYSNPQKSLSFPGRPAANVVPGGGSL